jgi:uncharacterized membrane protein HdeD (DUF308 family)
VAAGVRLASPVGWWLVLAHGVLSICLGALVLSQPGADDLLTLLALLGVYWLLGAALEVVDLGHDHARWAWKLLSGSVQVSAGLVVLRHPLWSTLLVPSTLVGTLGSLGLAIGATQLARGLVGGGWGAAGLALVSLPLGGIVLLCPPRPAVWAAGLWAVAAGAGALAVGLRLASPLASGRARTGRRGRRLVG